MADLLYVLVTVGFFTAVALVAHRRPRAARPEMQDHR
ncbi:hypothetical protein CLV34_2570 [Luteimicrobium subarcticum]|uniref:Uncharacterized protein n=1 Tax=Luteimicrobium subarcticum TaxID=620910 RepID=A0A2M8W6U3_9MICO|nr:hypothetical protein CLV34_2570 [Luteimicrobium subarcticum]